MLSSGDLYIIESIKRGEKRAFEFLFKSHYSDLCRYAFRLVRDEAIAEDLVMDIFTRFWEDGSKLNLNSSLSGYLYQSVHNHCINYITRKQKRYRGLERETANKLFALLEDNDGSDPFASLNFSELSGRIEKSIELLPDECKRIFVMSRNEDMPHKVIAASLGISENTVKVQVYRALKKLRILLSDFLTDNIKL